MNVVQLDKPREVRMTLGAMKAYEKASGQSVLEIDWTKIRATDISLLLWAALKQEDSSLTIEQVDAMVDESNFINVLRTVVHAWKEAVMLRKDEPNPFG